MVDRIHTRRSLGNSVAQVHQSIRDLYRKQISSKCVPHSQQTLHARFLLSPLSCAWISLLYNLTGVKLFHSAIEPWLADRNLTEAHA